MGFNSAFKGLRIIFLATELKRGHIKKLGKSSEEGCMYIKDWFSNKSFSLFLT
jgi:hypothetical protein